MFGMFDRLDPLECKQDLFGANVRVIASRHSKSVEEVHQRAISRMTSAGLGMQMVPPCH